MPQIDDSRILTAAELMRRKKMAVSRDKKKEPAPRQEKPATDIDDEIARLEAELAQDDSDYEESSSSEGESDTDSSEDRSDSKTTRTKKGVVSLSSVKDERIASLPEALLPKVPLKRKGNHHEDKKSKKRKGEHTLDSGLEMAVKEVLSGYRPRSSEKLPYYCRVCQKQYNNEAEFFEHRDSDFHKAAVEAERRASYCKLCRKQLTSPAQMKEHLQSKPHRDRLLFVASKQQQQQYRGNNRNFSRGGRGNKSSRQWV